MTTFQQDIVTFIVASTSVTNLVSTRVHYNYAPASSQRPNIWFRVNSDREPLCMDASGGLFEATIDLECVAETPGQAQSVAATMKDKFHGYKGNIGNTVCKGAFMSDKDDDYVPFSNQQDAGLHVAAFDLNLWYTTA